MTAAIELRNVVFYYSSTQPRAIGPINFKIAHKEKVTIVGPSGCGKSTILKLVCGLLPGSEGTIASGNIFSEWSRQSEEPRSIGFMFQGSPLLPHMTVLENILVPFLGKTPEFDVLALALEMLTELGLIEVSKWLPERLSGGMRTRVALCRALITKPELLLLDEPFTGLDFLAKERALIAVTNSIAHSDATVVAVTHDLEEAHRLSDRVIILANNGMTITQIEMVQQMDYLNFRRNVLDIIKT